MAQHRGHPVSGLEAAAGAGLSDHARHVDTQRERQLRTEVVIALAEQQVGEGHADRVDLDQDVGGRVVQRRVGNFRDSHRRRTVGTGDPDGLT